MSDWKHEVASRLRDIADKHGGPSAFAKFLGRTPQMMNDYYSGRTLPGNRVRALIREKCGEDIEFYIMYGAREEIEKRFKKNILVHLEAWYPEKAQMLKSLELHGITTAEQLNLILAARQQMILNEPQTTYKAKGRKK